MSSQALKAVATEGKSLKPSERIKVKLDSIQKQIAQAIPATMQRYLTPERQIRLFWAEARRNPTLLKCDAETVASSIMTASQLGIEIGVQGQGWLVPYFASKKKTYEAQFIIGYKGLIGLARRSGEVQSIETHIVYEKDEFELTLGIDTTLKHVPFLDGERGAPRLVYGVARFKDGGHHFEWMSLAEVEKIRARAKARDNGPWLTDYEQMVRKTLIRRMANYLPMSIEFANALTLDDAVAEGKKAAIDGEFVEIDEVSDADDTPPQSSANKADAATVTPTVTFAQVADALQKARSQDDLDAAADLIRSIDDETQRMELQQLYEERAKSLDGA